MNGEQIGTGAFKLLYKNTEGESFSRRREPLVHLDTREKHLGIFGGL